MIESKLDQPPAPPAGDAEFCRRIYLDLTGKIPPLQSLREFLADTSADKRATLIDRLLASPQYARRMQYVFDVLLLERRGGNSIAAVEWQEYLRKSFEDNKPYNQLAREILAADGAANRPAVKFYLSRSGAADTLTRDVGRLFLGMDLQCAQCHDHPLIEHYYQRDYYGIYAFLNRGFVFTNPKPKRTYYAEKAEGQVAFKSVFDPSVDEKNFLPRLRDVKPVADPTLPKGQEYFVKPAKNVRPIPRYSRRRQLAAAATDGTNAWFNTNIVNRLWHLMLGRGLVHPPGLQHAGNPPSHPDLLEELTREFVATDFHVKAFLRQVALSKTYQRGSEVPEGMSDSLASPGRYAVAQLRPLTPEQLAFSLMEGSGMCEPARAAERAKLSADPRLNDIFAASEKTRYLRELQIEQAVYRTFGRNVAQFVTLFGGSPGEPEQDFQATVHQALFVANGGTVRSWLAAMATRLQKMEDPRAVAEHLYMAILSRPPSEEETLEVVEYLLRKAESRAAGVQEIAWALTASVEFRFNH